jgi:hypothetical protein
MVRRIEAYDSLAIPLPSLDESVFGLAYVELDAFALLEASPSPRSDSPDVAAGFVGVSLEGDGVCDFDLLLWCESFG